MNVGSDAILGAPRHQVGDGPRIVRFGPGLGGQVIGVDLIVKIHGDGFTPRQSREVLRLALSRGLVNRVGAAIAERNLGHRLPGDLVGLVRDQAINIGLFPGRAHRRLGLQGYVRAPRLP